MEAAAALRHQARACRDLGSPMYAELLDVLSADYEAGGATREALRGHEDDPGPSALGLRLLGSVHRLVLTGRAPELARFYPSVGGRYVARPAGEALLRLVADQPAAVQEWIDHPVQTNEVGRAAALFGGLLQLPWNVPVRLFEMGASAGLNLLADRFAYVTGGGILGDPSSPVRLEPAWDLGPPSRPVRIVSRVGADVEPVDVSSQDGRLTLMAYVWPDQAARFARLRNALELAAASPPTVMRQDAVELVAGIEPEEGAVTVLWHSVMLQYLTAEDRARVMARIEEIGADAGPNNPLAHLSLEPGRRTPQSQHEFLVTFRTWPGRGSWILGTAAPHGLPVTWESDSGQTHST